MSQSCFSDPFPSWNSPSLSPLDPLETGSSCVDLCSSLGMCLGRQLRLLRVQVTLSLRFWAEFLEFCVDWKGGEFWPSLGRMGRAAGTGLGWTR